MWAIKNAAVEVQIRTRPRNWYSTITQIAVRIVATGEILYIKGTEVITNSIISATFPATYSQSGSQHYIALGNTSPASYISIYASTWGISFTASGCETYFGGGEGMCGSFDNGGIYYEDGTLATIFPGWTSAIYDANKATATGLASSWQIDPADSMFSDPSTICDPSSTCGSGGLFPCNAMRGRELQAEVMPGCTRTCADITVPQFEDQCEVDVLLTGDPTWPCIDAYIDPVISPDRVIVTPGYGRWYVNWRDEKCHQDCDASLATTCGGAANNWEEIFSSPQECCSDKLPFKNSDWCTQTSLGADYPGSGMFYVDNQNW